MRILIVSKMYPDEAHPDSGTFVRARAVELSRLGHHVVVLKVRFKRSQKFGIRLVRNFHDDSVLLYQGNGFRIPIFGWHVLPYRAIKKIAQREGIDLIQIHGGELAKFSAPLKKNCALPVAVTLHGSDIHTKPLEDEQFRKELLAGLQSADLSIFVSRYLLEKAYEIGFRGKRSVVRYNGVDRDMFRPEPSAERTTIGFVGHLSAIKRVNLLPRMFQSVAAHHPALSFMIIGDGPERESLDAEFRRMGLSDRVTFTGAIEQEDVASIMKRMLILVLPSLKESWGCVIKEAQSSGVMVVGSANAAIPEAIGAGGVSVPDREDIPTAFSEAIEQLIRYPIPEEVLSKACEGLEWSETVRSEAADLEALLRK